MNYRPIKSRVGTEINVQANRTHGGGNRFET